MKQGMPRSLRRQRRRVSKTTAAWLAVWALIISAATLLTYLGQLTVLILVYRRVFKEADRNAAERQQAIDKAGGMMQEQGKDMVRRMNEIAKRNTIGFSIMGICAAVMLFANRAVVRSMRGIIQKSRSGKSEQTSLVCAKVRG